MRPVVLPSRGGRARLGAPGGFLHLPNLPPPPPPCPSSDSLAEPYLPAGRPVAGDSVASDRRPAQPRGAAEIALKTRESPRPRELALQADGTAAGPGPGDIFSSGCRWGNPARCRRRGPCLGHLRPRSRVLTGLNGMLPARFPSLGRCLARAGEARRGSARHLRRHGAATGTQRGGSGLAKRDPLPLAPPFPNGPRPCDPSRRGDGTQHPTAGSRRHAPRDAGLTPGSAPAWIEEGKAMSFLGLNDLPKVTVAEAIPEPSPPDQSPPGPRGRAGRHHPSSFLRQPGPAPASTPPGTAVLLPGLFVPPLWALFSFAQSRRQAALAARRDLEVDVVYDHI